MYWKFVGGVLGLLCLFVCAVTVGNLVTWSQTLTKRPSVVDDTPARPAPAPVVQQTPLPQQPVTPREPAPAPKPAPTPQTPAIQPSALTEKNPTPAPIANNPNIRPQPAPPLPASPSSPMQPSPLEPAPKKVKDGAIRLANLKPAKATPSTMPSSQPTSQPGLAKYYNLLKNEFMMEDDSVRLITPDVTAAIKQIKQAAAAEKAAIDQDITDITRDIAAANAVKKNETRAKRDSQLDATRHANSTNRLHVTPYGGVHVDHSPYQAHLADNARSAARDHRTRATNAQSDIRALSAEKADLQKQSAALAAVASPYNRILPPRQFWGNLPDALENKLSKVGITLDQFRELLLALDLEESEFITCAQILEKESRSTDEQVDRLRDFFEERMGRPDPRQLGR